jgi:uncharacterized protein YejL (UPF0352 family)
MLKLFMLRGEEIMRGKKVQFILMAVVISAMLVSLAPLQAQASGITLGNLAKISNLKQSVNNNQSQALDNALTQALDNSALDPAAGQCVLSAVITDLTDLAACGDDGACKASVIVSMVLDVLNCADPNNQNVALLSCVLPPLTELSQINNLCGNDRTCRIQKIITITFDFLNCLKNYQGTTN